MLLPVSEFLDSCKQQYISPLSDPADVDMEEDDRAVPSEPSHQNLEQPQNTADQTSQQAGETFLVSIQVVLKITRNLELYRCRCGENDSSPSSSYWSSTSFSFSSSTTTSGG